MINFSSPTSSRVFRAFAGLAAAAMALVAITPALSAGKHQALSVQSEAADDVPFEAVDFADLDLGSARGVEALNGRIRAAVKRVCGQAHLLDLAGQQASRECRANAVAQADPQIELAVRQARSGRLAAAGSIRVAAR